MKLRTLLFVSLIASQTAIASAQEAVAHFDMSDGSEQATRFDGYTTFVKTEVAASAFSAEALTVNVILAAESYPMMQVDVAETTPTFATICGNLDEESKKGFAWQLSSQGDLRFRYGSANGFLMSVNGDRKLPRGEWALLTAVLDKSGNAATIYLNGEAIGTGRMGNTGIAHGDNTFYIGKDATDSKFGPFLINTFCGLIDDIAIYNSALTPTEEWASGERPDFNYPASRYEGNIWRPQFHGMPSGSWTNESHGLIYSGGRYHVFFQKNANGPYMSRLHWGHISSENLYDWTEEPIAIAPGEDYDIKGCWSGCVYEDEGNTYILYTAVDNAKATIAQAKAKDSDLREWEKQGVIINGRPTGLSDDFRDPYFFTANGQKYIIVGTSKNNVGACTLHKYENGSWTNDGSIFFQGGNASQHGTFWEMPNVTDMGDGKWLFTCTPLNTGVGVRTLCWVGTIGSDGKFTPETEAQYLEMGGISRDGYGLLSPSILHSSEGGLLLGIVPDKLATEENYKMGWAHNYSLPREISLAADGSLVQKPYSGLTGMRTETSYSKTLDLTGIESLAPVSGRQIELLGEFTVASGTCGFNFLKSGSKQVSLTYDVDLGMLTLDMTTLDRTVNDGAYGGIYTAALPQQVALGEKLKLHVFLDGSIADIFVNDTWAYSVRIFPNDASQIEAEVFATSQMQADVKAWTLNAKQGGETAISPIAHNLPTTNPAVYDLLGRKYSPSSFLLPPSSIIIKEGKKYVSR